MDCIVSAGGVPQADDLLFEYTQGKPKALLDLAGKPMVQWVLDALSGSSQIERIVLVGLDPRAGIQSPKIDCYVPDQGSLLANALAGAEAVLEMDPAAGHVVFSSADIPLITAAMVDEFIAQCDDPAVELFYGAVERSRMETRFPESRRSYVHLTDGDFAGADLMVVSPMVGRHHRAMWNDLIGSRKSALKQAKRVGLMTLAKLLLRRLSIAEAERRVSRALGITGRVVVVRHAELGMDVDKPFQLEICRRELSGR